MTRREVVAMVVLGVCLVVICGTLVHWQERVRRRNFETTLSAARAQIATLERSSASRVELAPPAPAPAPSPPRRPGRLPLSLVTYAKPAPGVSVMSDRPDFYRSVQAP